MVIVFQVILLFIIITSYLGVLGTSKNIILQDKMSSTFYASLLAYIVSVLWL